MTDYQVETKEFSEKTVDKAVKTACEYFKCPKEDLKIEIITRGSTGLFGLGGRKARIKAALRRKAGQVPSESTVAEQLTGQELETEPEVAKESVPGTVSETDLEEQKKAEVHEPGDIQPEQEQDISSSVRQDSREHGSRARPEKKTAPKSGREELPREIIERQAATARDFINKILGKSGLDGSAEIVEQESRPRLNITGDDISLIIGKEGKTLDALEYMVNLCLRKKYKDVNCRISLEANGYRERRRKSLEQQAAKMASKVRKMGKAISMPPMSARDRRSVHIALRKVKGVKTHSAGEGAGRKVVITPLKSGNRYARNRKRQG